MRRLFGKKKVIETNPIRSEETIDEKVQERRHDNITERPPFADPVGKKVSKHIAFVNDRVDSRKSVGIVQCLAS